ncbi:MAG: GGDEF domain-containing protein, partial [Treponema sp.]|nr:GGDEF domain-containing protein [Treponema sp.]
FLQTVSHLKEKHGCKKIAFLSAVSTNSSEAIERFEAFKNGLKENNLEFYPELVWDGTFTETKTEEVLSDILKSKKDVTFDAVVASNDNMALGMLNVLSRIGVKVPEDVKIIGFDDSPFSILTDPKLSTVNQQIFELGQNAAQTVCDVLEGKTVEHFHYTSLFPKYRQSCGCIDKNNSVCLYKDEEGKEFREDSRFENSIFKEANHLNEQNNIVTIIDMLKGSNTLRQFFFNLKFVVNQIDMDHMAINFYDEPVYLDSDEDFVLPKKAELYMFADLVNQQDVFSPKITFDPHEQLFSTDSYNQLPGIYILQPIYSGEANYGYILSRLKNREYAEYNVYLKIIINSLSQAYEYTQKIIETDKLRIENTKLQKSNSNLSKESKTDDLTGILNRRGFYRIGQQTLDVMQEMNSAGIVFFFDMDGLKNINDTFGHSMGDKAIKVQALTIKSVFRSSDVIGRLSGDEFGVVALGMTVEMVPQVFKKIEKANIDFSQKYNLPFQLSISFGYADLATSSVLKKLLTEADKELYKVKRIKHGQQ